MRLSLEHITVWEAQPPEIVSIAADLGCDALSLFVCSPNADVPIPDLAGDTSLRREIRQRLDDTGVKLHTLECFALGAETRVEEYRAALESGAWLGASAATAIFFDPHRTRASDNFAELCEIAGEYGLGLNAEFIALSTLPSLAAAVELMRYVDQPNAGITVDSLHLYRSGGSPAQLAPLAHGLIRFAQICDGPRDMPLDLQMFHEGFEQRQLPGEGAFPLRDFLRALPPDITLGVEVPMKDLREQGVTAKERARRAIRATRQLMEEVGL